MCYVGMVFEYVCLLTWSILGHCNLNVKWKCMPIMSSKMLYISIGLVVQFNLFFLLPYLLYWLTWRYFEESQLVWKFDLSVSDQCGLQLYSLSLFLSRFILFTIYIHIASIWTIIVCVQHKNLSYIIVFGFYLFYTQKPKDWSLPHSCMPYFIRCFFLFSYNNSMGFFVSFFFSVSYRNEVNRVASFACHHNTSLLLIFEPILSNTK